MPSLRSAPILSFLLSLLAAAAAPAVAEPLAPLAFRLPIPGGPALTGQVDFPSAAARCSAQGVRYPAVVMVPGSGAFDRDENFGNSKSPRDLLFKELAHDVTQKEVLVVRFDYRGVAYGGKVDLATRRQVTPESTRDDIARVFAYAQKLPCVDPSRVAVFAHSEGTIHVARLVKDRRILPNSLIFLGMVASSAQSIVKWQSIDRTLERIEREFKSHDRFPNEGLKRLGFTEELSPQGYWTREQAIAALTHSYEKIRQSELAKPDTEMKSGFWNYAYWKMWWRDDFSPLQAIQNYPYGVYAHFADQDDSTPGPAEMALFEKALPSFKVRPKLVMHRGVGHSLGLDRLVGPMKDDDRKQLVDDIVLGARAEAESAIDWGAVPYFGVLFSPTAPLPPAVRKQAGVREEYGLRLDRVIPSLPAWDAGLKLGDIVLALDGEEVGLLPKDDAAARLSHRARMLKPSTLARFKILRWKDRLEADPVPNVKAPASAPDLSRFVGEALEARPNAQQSVRFARHALVTDVKVPVRVPDPVTQRAPPPKSPADQKLEGFARELHRHYAREHDFDDLLKRLREGTVRPDRFRLARVDALQRDPFSLRGSTQKLLDRLQTSGAERALAAARQALGIALDENARPAPSPSPSPYPSASASPLPALAELPRGVAPAAHIAALRERLAYSDAQWNRAFAALSGAELKELREGLPGMAAKFLEWNYVYQDADSERLARHLRVLDALAKLDLRPLLEAARAFLPIAQAGYLQALRRDLERAGLDLHKPVVLEENTPFGKIRIAGLGDDEHRNLRGEEVALLIDLGGNDYYANQAATTSERLHSAVVVDVAGDDRYESAVDYSLGTGIEGVGMLIDLGGHDRYLGTKFSQGVGFAGVGVLVDAEGNDEYRAHQFAQGAGFFGTGVLVDGGGDDRYEARSHAQAVAAGGGSAFLIDQGGNDLYFAKGILPSGYSTPGTYEGWSQGMGVGLRFLASGGLAILRDEGGRDRMESGDFGLGGGYYYGLGILDARGSDPDVYVGNRYAIGTSAHYGIGVFLDEGGDDTYDTRGMVAVGISNDHSLSWFRDSAGNDRYPGQHFSGGSSANNSISVFEDTAGSDTWVGDKRAANGLINDYWGGTSLSLVFQSSRLTPAPLGPVEAYDGNSFIFHLGKDADALGGGALSSLELPPVKSGGND